MKRIFFFILITAVLAFAQGPVLGDSAGMHIKKGEVNGIPYLTGGVGIGERNAIEEMASQGNYNLKIVIASMSGSYLSDLMVVIEDRNGKVVFESVTNGPWLYVHLPEGTYKVTVSHDYAPKMRTVEVGAELQSVIFNWKLS